MNKQTTIKQITFTKTMVSKGVAAVGAAESAEALKLAFFKSIKGRVARDQITQARSAFQSVAYAYYDEHHKLDGALIEAIVEGKLKETTKLGSLTIRQHKENIRKMAIRWSKHYGQWLDTGIVAKHGGKGAKKRATKGAVVIGKAPNKPVDTATLNSAETVVTPVKAAIQYVTTIPRMVLRIPSHRNAMRTYGRKLR
jgi:hypothetical protein